MYPLFFAKRFARFNNNVIVSYKTKTLCCVKNNFKIKNEKQDGFGLVSGNHK